jgi:HAD superfamily hydrolase (TIGR01509 family)
VAPPIRKEMSKIKAILWDNDGVLVDTEGLYFLATREVLETIGVDLTEEVYAALFLSAGRGAWHLAEQAGATAAQIADLRRRRDDLYSEMLIAQEVIIDGAAEVLARLHGKYVMGIVTSSQKQHFELIHRSTGLLKYFDFVIANGDYQRSKPDPQPYLIAIERSGFDKDECIAVEDSERGLKSAIAAGVRCLIVPNRLTSSSVFSGAHKVLRSITDVPGQVG